MLFTKNRVGKSYREEAKAQEGESHTDTKLLELTMDSIRALIQTHAWIRNHSMTLGP